MEILEGVRLQKWVRFAFLYQQIQVLLPSVSREVLVIVACMDGTAVCMGRRQVSASSGC